MPDTTPTITVVVLNWNGREHLEGCFDAIRAQTCADIIHPLMVDNGSHDDSVAFVREHYPEVEIVETGENLGFAGGNNVGIRHARTPYVTILNNDTRMEPPCVEELLNTLESDPRCGSAASKVMLTFADNTIDAAGIEVCPDGLALGRGRMESGDRYTEDAEIFFSSDCCTLYRAEMLEDIRVLGEYYDEDFFAYADETDLGWRARLRGWRCLYNPRAVVWHHHSATAGSFSPFKARLVERNRIWVMVKSFPLWLIVLGTFYTVERYWWQAYAVFTGVGRAGDFEKEYGKLHLVKVLCRAWWEALRGLPRMLKKRRAIRRRVAIPQGEVRRLLKDYGTPAKAIALKG